MNGVAQLRDDFRSEIFRIVKHVACGLQTKIVTDTPIDSGRAKASWRINPNEADESNEPLLASEKNKFGRVLQSAGPDENKLTAEQALAVATNHQQSLSGKDEVIVISNSLDYIEKLEQGYSKQAPAGMTLKNTTADEIQLLIDSAIAERTPF